MTRSFRIKAKTNGGQLVKFMLMQCRAMLYIINTYKFFGELASTNGPIFLLKLLSARRISWGTIFLNRNTLFRGGKGNALNWITKLMLAVCIMRHTGRVALKSIIVPPPPFFFFSFKIKNSRINNHHVEKLFQKDREFPIFPIFILKFSRNSLKKKKG